MRAAERDAKREQRRQQELARLRAKLETLQEAQQAAEEYEGLIEVLTGAHRVDFTRCDWDAIAGRPLMPPAERQSTAEDSARATLAAYKPGRLARWFGVAARRERHLEHEIRAGIAADSAAFDRNVEAVAAENARIELAKRVVALDPQALMEVLGDRSGLRDAAFIEGLTLRFTDDGRMIGFVDGLDVEDMPTHSVTLLQSGKASIKPLSSARLKELHRDSICSAALRVATDFLTYVPAERVEIVVETDLLDPGTGRIEGRPVLYLSVAAQALETTVLARAEPLAVVERLGGLLRWSSKSGFSAIDLQAAGWPLTIRNNADRGDQKSSHELKPVPPDN